MIETNRAENLTLQERLKQLKEEVDQQKAATVPANQMDALQKE